MFVFQQSHRVSAILSMRASKFFHLNAEQLQKRSQSFFNTIKHKLNSIRLGENIHEYVYVCKEL